MKAFIFFFLATSLTSWGQTTTPEQHQRLENKVKPYYTPDYLAFRDKIIKEYPNAKPGRFGLVIKDVFEDVADKEKVLAFTFDACIGKDNDYNAPLIAFLRKERIPATLFVSGLWIDSNQTVFRDLAADSLFEMGNHGLLHRLCSIN